MTESEWMGCVDPMPMLKFLRDKASERKFRLFGCACCRLIWELLPHKSNRDLVACVEDYPDAKSGPEFPELEAAISASSSQEHELSHDHGYWAVKYLGRSYYKIDAFTCAITVAVRVTQRLVNAHDPETGEPIQKTLRELSKPSLLRCMFGNPFRPIRVARAWMTQTVVSLAQAIYQERAFDRMPILADALEDACCTDRAILDHLRGPGPHVRGCFALDLVLGLT
jgi:hypothetical protein